MPDNQEGAPYTLSDRVLRMEVELVGTREALRDVNRSVVTLAERVDGRPSWAYVTLLTLSVTANGVLATALLSGLHR